LALAIGLGQILKMVPTLRPSTLSRTLALVPPVVALVAQQSNGSTFLKIETSNGGTIAGESVDIKHQSWIEISSMQLGIANPVTLGAGSGTISAGKAVGSAVTITKLLDKSSPPLFLGCAQGTRYPIVTLELTSNGSETQMTYYKITLVNVIVSSLSTSSGGDRPAESVSLSYEKITTDYYLMDPKGGVPVTPTSTATWNFATNSSK
jgi:type VI secretion system secreted protein Hcp